MHRTAPSNKALSSSAKVGKSWFDGTAHLIMKQVQRPIQRTLVKSILSLETKASEPAGIKIVGTGSKKSANGVFRDNSERNHFYTPLYFVTCILAMEKTSVCWLFTQSMYLRIRSPASTVTESLARHSFYSVRPAASRWRVCGETIEFQGP